MDRPLTAHSLFEQTQNRLKLSWVSNPDSTDLQSLSGSDVSTRPDLAGYLNLIHPNQIQVLGQEELRYFEALPLDERHSMENRLAHSNPLAILVGDHLEVPEFLTALCKASNIPLWRSPTPSLVLVNFLQYYVSRQLARRTTLHGVFLEVFTIGVLISGEAGCGKSELALELLTRGHRLIADDAPEFMQISPDVVEGNCPEALQDWLEVRRLGILNIRQMLGDSAIKTSKFLRLIVNLKLPNENVDNEQNGRLRGNTSTQQVLDLNMPRIDLPVLPGRNLAVIVEAAVRDFMLKMKGIDAASDFIERHNQLMGNTH